MVGVDAECADATFPGHLLRMAQELRRHALAAFAVGDGHAVYHYVRPVGEPFAFEGLVGRFSVERHRAVGDDRTAFPDAGPAQHIAAAATDVRRDMSRGGIPVLPLAAACRAHPGLRLPDDLHDEGRLAGHRLPECRFLVHVANVNKCRRNVVLSGHFFSICDNS